MNNKENFVDLNNIYFSNLYEEKYDSEKKEYVVNNSVIILEDTLKERDIDRISFREFSNVITDEMLLVDDNGNIFYPKKGCIKYIENTMNIPELLDKINSKHNSKYTDYIYSQVISNLNERKVPRTVLFDNLDNIEFLGSYVSNVQKEPVRKRVIY